MIFSIHTLELTIILDTETFHRTKNKAYKNSKGKNRMYQVNKGNRHIDQALKSEGIKIEYHDDTYKKKVKLIVNPTKLLGGSDIIKLWKPKRENIDLILKILENYIVGYFDGKYKLNDFKLTRIDFTVNIYVGNKDYVAAYIKVFHKLGKVKGYKYKYEKNDPFIDKDLSFDLEGNSNGIEFTAYDKEGESKRKEAEGLLRIEVKLVKQKSISNYTKEAKVSEQITDLALRSKEVFLNIVNEIIPYGNYYKKNEANKIINERISKKKSRGKMMELMELIPQKKSLYLARKEMNDRNVDKVIDMFGSINVSPVTISKSCKMKYLNNLYSYLLDEI